MLERGDRGLPVTPLALQLHTNTCSFWGYLTSCRVCSLPITVPGALLLCWIRHRRLKWHPGGHRQRGWTVVSGSQLEAFLITGWALCHLPTQLVKYFFRRSSHPARTYRHAVISISSRLVSLI